MSNVSQMAHANFVLNCTDQYNPNAKPMAYQKLEKVYEARLKKPVTNGNL